MGITESTRETVREIQRTQNQVLAASRTSTVQIGGSLYVAIPSVCRDEENVEEGDTVERYYDPENGVAILSWESDIND